MNRLSPLPILRRPTFRENSTILRFFRDIPKKRPAVESVFSKEGQEGGFRSQIFLWQGRHFLTAIIEKKSKPADNSSANKDFFPDRNRCALRPTQQIHSWLIFVSFVLAACISQGSMALAQGPIRNASPPAGNLPANKLTVGFPAIDFPVVDATLPIQVTSKQASQIDRGDYRIFVLQENCELRQGEFVAQADRITLWTDRLYSPNNDRPAKLLVQLQGNVRASWGDKNRLQEQQWSGRLYSFMPADVRGDQWVEIPAEQVPELQFDEPAGNANNNRVMLAQYQQPTPAQPPQPLTPQPLMSVPPVLSPNSTTPSPSSPNPSPNSPSPPGLLTLPNAPAMQLPGQLPQTLPAPQPQLMLNPSLPQVGSTLNSEAMPRSGITLDPGNPIDDVRRMQTPPTINNGLPPGNLNAPPAPIPGAGLSGPGISGAVNPPVYPSTTLPNDTTVPSNGLAAKSLTVRGRSSTPPQVRVIQRPERGDSIAEITRGVYIQIAGARYVQPDGTLLDLGSIDIETDRAIAWLPNLAGMDLTSGSTSVAGQQVELYLEGNIVFRQGQRVIFAERMYYNVQQEYGMILAAEVLTPIPEYQGLVRLKADVLQQRNRQNFLAYDAAVTSSRLGVPRYWVQAQQVELQDERPETTDAFGRPVANNDTGMRAKSSNNFVYLGGVPIFYWPVLSTNLAKPTFYVSNVKFKNDNIFGTQVLVDSDLYQILGIDGADGTEWTLSTDYLSERGFALGTNFNYDVEQLIPGGRAYGNLDFWGINDEGLDLLGVDRVNLVPEETRRGRLLYRHRHLLNENLEFWAEVGLVSDRNFMEQYFEREWDQQKDYSTALRLRRYADNQMFDLAGQARVNDFYTETEWLPRLDHFLLGQSLLSDRLTWYSHSNVGYGHQRVASTPTDPADAAKFALLPYEVDREGLRAATRQELSAPFNAGPVKLSPYVSGEAAFWGEDINGEDMSRLTGQAGIRASMPMWRTYPNIQSRLLDVRGLSHKVTFESELFYADTNKNLDLLPLYDPLDDNSQEHFRRRLVFNTFAGALPPEFDERGYAVRSGLQRWVSANSTEVVEDQLQARFGINQRWQTKRGLPGRDRITDLIELDVDAIFFPRPERDNFGEDVGAINYDFRYHIGDRLTLLSDGYFDVFSQGLKTVSIGAQIQRLGRGDLYIGATSLEGPISSNVLTGALNYRLSEKWIMSGAATFDLSEVGNVGQTLALTRIGESFLVRVGINVDSGRDNVGFIFNIEPRFIPANRLGQIGGELIPPAGLFGLE